MGTKKRTSHLPIGICLIGVFSILSFSSSYGQLPGYYFHHLKTVDGLSQASNAYVYQDSRGFIWISSLDGLNRFDGLEVRRYRPKEEDPKSIEGQLVNSSFFEDQAGNLWFSTYSAVNRYNRKTDDFDHWTLINDHSGDTLRADYHVIHLDEQTNRLWVQVGDNETGQLFFLDTQLATQQRIGPLLGNRFAVAKTSDAAPPQYSIYSYFYFREGALYKTDLIDDQIIHTSSHFEGQEQMQTRIFDLCLHSDTIVLAGNFGLAYLYPGREDWLTCPMQGGYTVQSIAIIDHEYIAVSTQQGGLFFLESTHQKPIFNFRPAAGHPGSISSNTLNDLYLAPDRTLWISDWNAGLNYIHLEKPKVQNILLNELVAGGPSIIRSMVEDQYGNVWCATNNKGVIVFDREGNFQQLNHTNGLYNPSVIQLLLFGETMFALTDSNVLWWDARDGRFREVVGYDVDFDDDGILGILRPERLYLQAGKVYEIKKRVDQQDYFLVASDDYSVLKNQFIDYWYRSLTGELYCNINNASTLRIKPEGQVDTLPEAIQNLKACWESGEDDTIWMATTYGLFKMSKTTGEYLLFDESNGLPNQYLYGLAADSSGHLWIPTNQGILRMHTTTHQVDQLVPADGIWEYEFYTNAYLSRANGELWFGNLDVLNVIDPAKYRRVSTIPRIQITELLINDQRAAESIYIGERNKIELPFAKNTLSLKFVALEYSDPQNNQLWYRLEGYDKPKQWLAIRKGVPGFARYAKIHPGRYYFQIMAANSDGIRTPQAYELEIVIQNPFYYEWWFIIGVISCLIAAAYSIYRYRVAQIHRTLLLQQQTIESEMKALRAQMNPHFIFNCINSINAYILQNRTTLASKYLTNFAGLIRQILAISARETIPLEEEIEFLEAYLKAEQMRLKDKLKWKIEVDDSLDTFETEIPTMILQPFVENAIWHGISKKTSPGQILIQLIQEPTALKCVVEDNGIGRAAAKKLRQRLKSKHQSRGESNTRERLILYDQKHHTNSSWKIHDLHDESGQPAGTRVVLKIGVYG